jgi:formylglycine-generating enzyme required for sulfatase activity
MKRVFLYCLLLSALAMLSGQAISNVRVNRDPELGYYAISFDLNGEVDGVYAVGLVPRMAGDELLPAQDAAGKLLFVAGTGLKLFWNPLYEGLEADGWQFDLTAEPTPLAFAQGGSFSMGTGDGPGNEQPAHKVTVSSFFIGKNELTVGEYRRFINATGYRSTAEKHGGIWILNGQNWERKPEVSWDNPNFTQDDKHPVSGISWYDAIAYCNWLSRWEELDPAYSIEGNFDPQDWMTGKVACDFTANGYRLPTEAEWEYAARGADKGRGYKFSGSSEMDSVGWCKGNADNRTHPSGSKAPNELGIHDMSGNLWEWCWDWYDNRYYEKSPASEPKGPDKGLSRVFRGGSWMETDDFCHVTSRLHLDPEGSTEGVGMRLARTGPRGPATINAGLMNEILAVRTWAAMTYSPAALEAELKARINELPMPEQGESESVDSFEQRRQEYSARASATANEYQERMRDARTAHEAYLGKLRMRLCRLLARTRETIQVEGSPGKYDNKTGLMQLGVPGKTFEIVIPPAQIRPVMSDLPSYKTLVTRQLDENLEWSYLEASFNGSKGDYASVREIGVENQLNLPFANTVPPAQARAEMLMHLRAEAIKKALPPKISLDDLVADMFVDAAGLDRDAARSAYLSSSAAGMIVREEIMDEQFNLTKGSDKYAYMMKYEAGVLPWELTYDPELELKVELSMSTVQDGEGTELSVSANRDGYLYVFEFLSDGTVTLLLPGNPEPANELRQDEAWTKGLSARIAPGKGEGIETLYFVFSTSPIGSYEDFGFVKNAEAASFSTGEESFTLFQRWLAKGNPQDRVENMAQIHILK